MRQHRFTGRGDLCAWPSVDVAGSFCLKREDHPIHNVDVDPDEVLLRRMLGSRRDYRDIELGNPTLKDRGV